MDQAEINNWKTIAEKMEASGDIESWFYLRARAIADGKQDPMPTVSELMPKSAWLETIRSCPRGVREAVGVTPPTKTSNHAWSGLPLTQQS